MNSRSKPWWAWGCHDQLTDGDRRHMRRLNLWLVAWMGAYVVGTFLLRRGVVPSGPTAFALAAAFSLPVIGVVRSYLNLLREGDELLRKIHLDAMAAAFATGVVFVYGWSLMESAGAPALDLGDAAIPMILAYAIAQARGQRRYR